MGNLHNLFGSTNAVHIRLAAGGGYAVEHVERGDTNAEVLEMMDHDPKLLLERLRLASEEAIARGNLRISEARLLMAHLKTSLGQTTYLQGRDH
jgi:arginine decarboxylase